jgi:hypothetical protein
MPRAKPKVREKARALFLSGEASSNVDIARHLRIKPHTVAAWRKQEGWDELRIAVDKRAAEKLVEEIAEQLAAEAEEREKTLPVVIHFVVSHEQAELIETAVERASDGVVGRDRKARGLVNLAKRFLEGSSHATG